MAMPAPDAGKAASRRCANGRTSWTACSGRACAGDPGASRGARPERVIEALDPESITPSIELLEQVLSLAGSLPEARLGPLRRMVRRVVDALVEELAVRVRPALSGGVLPRATRRRTGRLQRGLTSSSRRVAKRGAEIIEVRGSSSARFGGQRGHRPRLRLGQRDA